MGHNTYGTAADKNRSDIIDNINEILNKLIQQQLEIDEGKRINEYRNIYNIYSHEIIVTHVNNSPPEVIFGKRMDKHAYILDLAAKIPIEVYQIIAGHKEVYTMIWETPNNKLIQQIAQIYEVAKLREFANNVLNKETIQEEWSKEKNKELEQNKEIYKGMAAIPFGMQFEEPAIIDLADQMRYVQEEIKRFKETNRISEDQQVWKNKDIIEQIEDEYQFNKKKVYRSQKLIKGKPQPEPFLPEGAIHNRYIPKDNTYRERPISPTSSEKDFSLKSRNIGEWLKSQAKEPPRPKNKNEEITSEDKKEMNELDNIIENNVQDYFENKYNNQEETAYKYTLPKVACQNYESIQHEYENNKEETNKGYGIAETDKENNSLYEHFREMPIEI
ncbi:16616_t:CDS:2 [Cetraspora pellucida]|uniref:16616_t:CDS:1 n=1 Tax=Cetraspora pellucida TaxID=1433469 RepID=A0A9N9B9U5_9GLOM|nr:16616_t:CDS:2 [Cetraspora pellucida]